MQREVQREVKTGHVVVSLLFRPGGCREMVGNRREEKDSNDGKVAR